jgi:hypothetical protein
MRIFVGALLGLRDAREPQHVDRLLPRLPPAHLLVQQDRFRDLAAYGEHGIERGHRLLEDHRDVLAAHRAHRLFVERQQIDACQLDLAAGDAAGRIGHQPHQRQRCNALAAARFADDRQGLVRREREADAVYGFHGTEAQVEIGAQVLDREQGRGRLSCGFAGGQCHVSVTQPRIKNVAQRIAE